MQDQTIEHDEPALAALRGLIRAGRFTGPTAGRGGRRLQGNLVILPADWAEEFEGFCRANPRPCPLLGRTAAGDPHLPADLGPDLDLRWDLPRYRVWRDGRLVAEPTDIADLWQTDWVGFVIGCSFSFERALVEAGIPLRHHALGRNVAMYRSSLPTRTVGRFGGPTVVSMRPIRIPDLDRVVAISAGFPEAHGAPLHIGDPAAIGISDLDRPDEGDPVPVLDGEVPVFWACGVTPQAALAAARPPLCITHAPGCMLITDRLTPHHP